jgi:hypothetical protein
VEQTAGRASNAGIVYQNVDASVGFAKMLAQRFHAGKVGQVTADAFGTMAAAGQVACHLLDARLVTTRANDGRFHERQLVDNGMANAAAASGHDSD